jgi:hypothetical protein
MARHYKCDGCGEAVPDNHDVAVIHYGKTHGGLDKEQHFDVCPACLDRLLTPRTWRSAGDLAA